MEPGGWSTCGRRETPRQTVPLLRAGRLWFLTSSLALPNRGWQRGSPLRQGSQPPCRGGGGLLRRGGWWGGAGGADSVEPRALWTRGPCLSWPTYSLVTPSPCPHHPSSPPRLEAGPVRAPLGGLVTGHSEALLLSRVAGSVCSWASTPGAELGHLSHDLKPKPFWKKCSFPGVPVSIV